MSATRSFCLLFPFLSHFLWDFQNTLVKSHSTRLRRKFLQSCLQEQVIPKSLLPRRLRIDGVSPFNDFCVLSLKQHIKITKRQENLLFKKLSKVKRNFEISVPGIWLPVLHRSVYSHLREKLNVLKNHLDNKLKNLIQNSAWENVPFNSCVVNLSSKSIPHDAERALSFGMSFSLINKPNSIDVASAFAKLEKNSENKRKARRDFVPNEHIDIARGIVYAAMSVPSVCNFPLRYQKALKNIKNDQDLHITKADKSNMFVMMDKAQYDEKMNNLLSDTSTYTKLRSDPLDKVISFFNSNLKSIFKNDKERCSSFTSYGSSLPYMYGLIKTHKQGNPIRPIISASGSITYKLSKYLVSLLSPILGTISEAHLLNSVDLHERLNKIKITPNSRLVSFDVTSLFTKVPVDDLLDYLASVLDNYELSLPTGNITSLIFLCIKNCKFSFNGNYFEQVFGMSMGNPLSPLLSNIYMEFFEKNLIPSIYTSRIIWYRYVDDILCILNLDFDIEGFLAVINSLAPTIKFTVEKESNKTLPFLDILIYREENCLKFSVYRKPTNNLSYVHFFSGHSKNVKISVFSTMYLRALRICSPEFIDEEFSTIQNVGKNLCYPKYFLEDCLNSAKRTFYGRISREKEHNMNVLSLPYHKNFVQISPLLKKLNISTVFNFKNNLKNYLIKNSPKNTNNVIYHIPCKNCNSFYLGQTSKKLEDRVSQHRSDISKGNTKNGLAVHWLDTSHQINLKESSTIMKVNDFTKRNLCESFLINKTMKINLNLSPGLFCIDPVLNAFLEKDLSKQIEKVM